MRRLGAGHARQLSHEERIGQAVKTVALDSLRLEAPGNGQDLGDPRHVAVKGRVEARYLRYTGDPLTKQIDYHTLGRQMLRSVGADATQLIQQFMGDALRLAIMGTAVYYAVADRPDRSETDLLVEPIDQEGRRRPVIEVADAAAVLPMVDRIVKRQSGAAEADAVDFAMQLSLRRVAHPIQRELDARRAAIHRQHVRLLWGHETIPLPFDRLSPTSCSPMCAFGSPGWRSCPAIHLHRSGTGAHLPWRHL